jgi:capsular polysaccharide biosynthesis protein
MSSYAQMGTTARVLEPVISSLQLEETPPTLAGHVVSQSRVKTAFIDVSVEYNDPALAARIADTAARQLGTTMEQLENGNLRVVVSSPAAMPMAPSNHRLTVNLLFGAASGLILGIAIALLLGLMSVRLGRTTGKR